MRSIAAITALSFAIAGCTPQVGEPSRSEAVKSIKLSDVELIPRDALFSNPERTEVTISPDGRYIGWVAPSDGVPNVWIAPADNLAEARAVTHDRSRGISSYTWSHLPGTLLFVRDNGGDENYHVFALDVATGEQRDISPFEKIQATLAGTSRSHPEEVLIGMNDRDPRWHDLYRVNLTSGTRTLVERNDQSFRSYVTDGDFTPRLATRAREDGGFDVLRRSASGSWEAMDTVPFEDALTTVYSGVSEDGQTAYLADSRDRNTSALFAVDLNTGKRSLLHEDLKADVTNLVLSPIDGSAQAAASNYLREQWVPLAPSFATDIKKLKTLGPGNISLASRTDDDRIWIVTYSSPQEPEHIYRYDRGPNGALTRLFSSRPKLDNKPLVAQWPQELLTRDGLTMVSYLTLPKHADSNADGSPEQPSPMVLLVHGGPWDRDKYGFSSHVQWLANRGYAVLQVNFRGSTGFGKDFVNKGNLEWGAKMHDDLLDAVQWAVDTGVTTSSQIAIMGGSYGGYATLVGLTSTPDTFKCGIDVVGPSNLQTLIASTPARWSSSVEQLARRVGDARTEEGRELLAERSPIHHTDQIIRPLLIAQGANDPRVPQAESDQIIHAMKVRNIPVTYLLFPDEGHGFVRAENSAAFTAVAETFLSKCLGGRSEPIGTALSGSSITVPVGAEDIPQLALALKNGERKVLN
ncbi:S9 family peptidase [Stenotrophomonas geniculata]|uniref:S9 family peptidase n=1 Tax=Stenotrophomonas TaxID=40323 RepID=UPI001E0A8769|nr:S9 family peptidase [Stenotrophomonas lactitubi]CAH0250480.1 Dipeptidyl aminopeptidase BIII [Stenotrophomonas lactitubi]CAH0269796.1 Dipeptidyl aminopeptidase BIII [Stenotrophomonas lactitubi]CAH0285571.1 Dipeptidyl aminopeptidase BIII [Stenotrophomonas lactitubi]CAH0289171.1 Dipeptidyl aminopeptidase BIII [Stenotrophomonas lactitubi]